MGIGSRRLRALLGVLAGVLAITALALPPTAGAVPTPRVVGGQRASIDGHPWAVYLTTADGFQYCGGTLVAPHKVLTAAHCAKAQDTPNVRVVAGREDKQSAAGIVAAVTAQWWPKEFRAAETGDDYAVLTLDRDLPYLPLALPEPADAALYADGSPAVALGWGRTSESGNTSRYLMAVTVPLVADADCSNSYPTQYVPAKMVCAGYVVKGGKDTCQGDSGGPLTEGGRLIGLTSWGDGCARAGKPGVYTRLINYRDPILQQINS
ncbi:serine protease [Solihabitans fulvus]|uniref:Serine protease n=1 Tax=Solihabitans fulvus TaxID=1892852 RepID=A0A5B2X6J3_9PSEU|nr:serine protease [Solihabitans fulvus]KAA2258552.1 serine protease [Solihabitans fulvus]